MLTDEEKKKWRDKERRSKLGPLKAAGNDADSRRGGKQTYKEWGARKSEMGLWSSAPWGSFTSSNREAERMFGPRELVRRLERGPMEWLSREIPPLPGKLKLYGLLRVKCHASKICRGGSWRGI